MTRLIHRIVESFQKLIKCIKLKFDKKQTVPQYILFQDFFRCERTANLAGYTFLNVHETSSNKWIKLNSLVFQFSISLLFLLQIISFAVSFKQKLIYEAIDNLFCCGIIFIALFKIYFVFYHNKAKISEIMDTLDRHFPHSGVDQLNFKVYSYLKVLKLHEKGYQYLLTFVLVHFCSMPFFHQVYGKIKSINVEWELMLPIKLPFDQSIPMVYASIMLIQTHTCIFGILSIISTDLIFASLLQTLSMEFDILGQIISEINTENEEEAIKELKILVDIHQELIEASEKLEEVFAPLQLINTFGSIIALCTACFLTMVNPFLRDKNLNLTSVDIKSI